MLRLFIGFVIGIFITIHFLAPDAPTRPEKSAQNSVQAASGSEQRNLVVPLTSTGQERAARNRQLPTVPVEHTVESKQSIPATPTPIHYPNYSVLFVNRELALRANPAANADPVRVAEAGESVVIVDTDESGEWYQLVGGEWIPTQAVSLVAPTLEPSRIDVSVNRDANLRAGPGTGYQVVGFAQKGSQLQLVSQVADGSWYGLSSGEWIAGFLLEGLPEQIDDSLIAVLSMPTKQAPTATPLPPTSLPPTSTSSPVPPPPPTATPQPVACLIKGNVAFDDGEKIYHVPGQNYYDQTKIDARYGERWFCSEAEAQAAGWRKARN